MRKAYSWLVAPSLMLVISVLLLCGRTRAQVPDPAVSAEKPQPGGGHHYIGLGTETVNPATGLLTFNLPIQTPAGRSLSFPFGISYSSAEQYYLTHITSAMGWVQRDSSPYEVNGWSYQLPVFTSSARISRTWNKVVGGQPVYAQCDATIGHTFSGLGGTQYTLLVGYTFAEPKTAASSTDCESSFVTTSNLHGIGAVITPGNGSCLGGACSASLYVYDPSGTKYVFGYAYPPSVEGDAPNPVAAALASSITDRNGNQIVLAGQGYKDTAGRSVVSWSGIGNNGDTVSISGLSNPITIHWTNISGTHTETATEVDGNSTPGCSLSSGETFSSTGISEIDLLPNGQKYTFSYDPTFGRVSKIVFPSGGYVRYVWGLNSQSAETYLYYAMQNGAFGEFSTYACYVRYDEAVVKDRYVSFDGSTEVLHQHFDYGTTWQSDFTKGFVTKQTTVTTTDNVTNQTTITTYNYIGLRPDQGPYDVGGRVASQIPVESSVVYQNGSGSTLETINKTWGSFNQLIGDQIILDNGQGKTTLRCYNSDEQVTALYEYDFQANGGKPADPSCVSSSGLNQSAIGPLLRQTTTLYQPFFQGFTNGQISGTHIVNAPETITVANGAGSTAKQTTFSYTDTVQASGTGVGLVSPPGTDRGNVASISKEISSGLWATTSYTYFDTGQLQSTTDPCGNTTCSDMPSGASFTTTYSYNDSYSSGTPPGQTNAYLTHMTNPLGQSETFSYDYNKGLLTSHKDQNDINAGRAGTTYSYGDPLARLTQVNYPDGGQTAYAYNDSTYSSSANTPNITATTLVNASTNQIVTKAMDGVGHTVRTILATDPNGPVSTDTTYDGFGRTHSVSNPYASTNDSTYGITTYSYDTLGRTLTVQNPDASTRTMSYTGRATLDSDEGNGTRRVQRISQVDGLGRVTSLCEVTSTTLPVGSNPTPTSCGLDISATGFLTTYSYDTLDNVLAVSQGSLAGRSFNYDYLSRLTSATNPESGTITYNYDSNSNVSSKTAPLPNQTNSSTTVIVKHTYDPLNRITSTWYTDSTPSNYFAYDQTSGWGHTLTNSIGRMTSESRTTTGQNSQSIFSYDPMGRVANVWGCTPINCGSGSFAFSYTYDYAGNLTSASNGLGTVITYGPYNGANEPTAVTSSLSDSNHPGTLMNNITYNPLRKFVTAGVGNDVIYEHFTYSNRGVPTSYWACTGGSGPCNSQTLLYTYAVNGSSGVAPNGDFLSVTDTVNGNWTYTYDDFNRLSTAVGSTGLGCSWDYDRYGNRWHQNTHQGSCTTPTFSFTGNNNRMDCSSCYDAAGNLLNDGTHNYTYDAENRIVQVDGGNTATYVYDADGRRIQKTTSGTTVDYLYDLEGHEITEVSSGGVWNRGEVYADGEHLATYRNGTTYFNFSDWLGTERARATIGGVVCETIASLPFGDSQTITGSCGDTSPKHFTGKERDSETGLDMFGARYYANSMGRFMTPDWSSAPIPIPYADLDDPQSLNQYGYVRNNPLNRTDSDGHCTVEGKERSFLWCVAHALGFVETQKERSARIASERKLLLASATSAAMRTRFEKMTDTQIDELYKGIQDFARQQDETSPLASAVVMTQWGWSGSKAYREARNQLKQPGTHENLGGKVPTQDEAVQMIEESGGTIDRIEEGHGPDSVSSHNQPHINYTTAGGDKATVIIQAVTH
jgi:RHS repeat-associated protein